MDIRPILYVCRTFWEFVTSELEVIQESELSNWAVQDSMVQRVVVENLNVQAELTETEKIFSSRATVSFWYSLVRRAI